MLIPQFSPYHEPIPTAVIPALNAIRFPGCQEVPVTDPNDALWWGRIHRQIAGGRAAADLELTGDGCDGESRGTEGLHLRIPCAHPGRFVGLALPCPSGHTGPITRRHGASGRHGRIGLGLDQRGSLLQVCRLVAKELLDRIPKIDEEVPTIGDWEGVRGALSNRFNKPYKDLK